MENQVDEILKPWSKRHSADEHISSHTNVTINGGEPIKFGKRCWKVGTFADLKDVNNGKWKVPNRRTGEIVRTIEFKDEFVNMKAGDDVTIVISLDTTIYFEPWEMDVGSYVFMFDEQICKLMTEGDTILQY